MTKKKYILLIGMLSTMLCACANGKEMGTSEYKELNLEYESTSSVNDESTETEEQENVMDASTTDTSIAEFLPSNTCTFEYDPVYDLITVDGATYTIATNEMDYSGGYMPYYMANSTMENIVECINSGDLSDTSWRDGCSDKLQKKIKESDLLEHFVNSGGKILDYYIINGDFYGSFDDAEMPVIIHYSIGEEKYYSIWGFYMQKIVEPEQSILYQMADIFQIDNLDGHTPEITEFRLGRNLENAISQLALMYYFFDASQVEGNEYASEFIAHFLQNSRCTFGYLEQLREEQNGILTVEDVEYIQWSLTNQRLDFGEVVPLEGININQNAKGVELAEISSYEAEIDGDKVHLAVTLKRRPDEFSLVEYFDLNVVLMKNPESCFEGYSILSLTSIFSQ